MWPGVRDFLAVFVTLQRVIHPTTTEVVVISHHEGHMISNLTCRLLGRRKGNDCLLVALEHSLNTHDCHFENDLFQLCASGNEAAYKLQEGV